MSLKKNIFELPPWRPFAVPDPQILVIDVRQLELVQPLLLLRPVILTPVLGKLIKAPLVIIKSMFLCGCCGSGAKETRSWIGYRYFQDVETL